MGAGRDSCGQEIVVFTLPLHFLRIFCNLRIFGWVLGAPGLRLGLAWAQTGHQAPIFQIEVLGVTFGTSRPDFGGAWELFYFILFFSAACS
jgi:hypothetical protein